MKRFNRLFALCLTLSVLGGTLLPFPATCDGFSQPLRIEVQADGDTTDIDTGIGVLITMLLANGIRFVGNFNDTVKPGIEKLWEDFTTATGNQITLATLGAQSVLSLGYLRTSSAVNNAVNAFQNWFVSDYSVPISGDVDIPVAAGEGTYFLFDGTCTLFTRGNGSTAYLKTVDSSGNSKETRAICIYDGSRYYMYFVSDSSFGYGHSNNASCSVDSEGASFLNFNGTRYYFYNLSTSGYSSSNSIYSSFPILNIYGNYSKNESAIYYTFGQGAVIGDISMTGQSLDLIDGYDISNDQAKLIDLAGIESLVGVLGLTLENVNDLIDSIPLIMDYPWAESFPDDPTYSDTPFDAIPWVDAPTAVVPAEVPEYVPETPADEGSYKVLGLERVFPFSIPFDFIAVVNLLNAEPVCPEFTFRVYNPISGQNIDATMSFNRFEAVAEVIRIAETIGFIVFLIIITRSLIRS